MSDTRAARAWLTQHPELQAIRDKIASLLAEYAGLAEEAGLEYELVETNHDACVEAVQELHRQAHAYQVPTHPLDARYCLLEPCRNMRHLLT